MLNQIGKVRTHAHLTNEITELEKMNFNICRRAGQEAVVLLENNGVLPLDPGISLALMGDGASNTVKCGSGSGEVNDRHSVSVYEAFRRDCTITTAAALDQYMKLCAEDRARYYINQQKRAGLFNLRASMDSMKEPYRNLEFPPAEKVLENTEKTDTCVYVISRISGESYDRQLAPGDYYLTEREIDNLRICRERFRQLILIINAGGPVDLCPLDDRKPDAIIYMSMLGSAGGYALADCIFSRVSPSGHLASTWPLHYEDIPYAMKYAYLNGNEDEEYYREGIYVGYRYFDTFHVPVRYCFGHGLSYTAFQIRYNGVSNTENGIRLDLTVSNTGKASGKEVVQVYAALPAGNLDKERRRLAGFVKTGMLKPGESEDVSVSVPLEALASFDDSIPEFVLEKGNYVLEAGESLDLAKPVCAAALDKNIVLSRHDHICEAVNTWEDLRSKKEDQEEDISALPQITINTGNIRPRKFDYTEHSVHHDKHTDDLMAKLSVNEMVDIIVGAGNDMIFPMKHFCTVPGATGYSTCKFSDRGIYDLSFCDGPAGIRLQQNAVVMKGKNITKGITSSIDVMNYMPSIIRKLAFGKAGQGTPVYQYLTAFPVGTALAQTWNEKLVEETGRAVNTEMEEYGVNFWLAPGMNIQRNPLCGRNYEYYSEDPLLCGKAAAAMTRGAQCMGRHSVSLKHFLGNNQETNRASCNSNISERALREIYLRGFGIAVREGKPKGLMTSYNQVNGVYSANNYDTLTKVLRCEWGFDGLVMTDWDFKKKGCDTVKSVIAGVDILMAGDPRQKTDIGKALRNGLLDKKYVIRNASNILKFL